MRYRRGIRPDGVVLATPNQLHVERGLECIKAGVPVLVEKPLAHTLEEGRRLVEAAEKATDCRTCASPAPSPMAAKTGRVVEVPLN